MSKYRVTVSSTNNYNVTFIREDRKQIIDVNDSDVYTNAKLSQLSDVDQTNRNNNYLLVWNDSLQKHEYISPFEIIDRSDGIDDDALDYGTY